MKNVNNVNVEEAKDKTKSKDSGYSVAYNPASLQEIGRVKKTDLSKAHLMFEKARRAQKIWAEYSFEKRAKHMAKIKKYIVDHSDELADIVSKSTGKTKQDALAAEIVPIALATGWYANNAKKVLKPTRLPLSSIIFVNKATDLIRVPLGIVGIIGPWNYPLSIPFGEIIMGLMAGNAVMLKVSASSIMVGKAIDDIIKAGELPDGLFHHLVGSGPGVSKAFFENKIDKIFFTGSVAIGKTLMANATETLTPLSLELGGKDPAIVFADAELERATNGIAWAGYQNAGQSCAGVERVYVHESVYDRFVEILAEKTKKMRHGLSIDSNVDMGSMTTKEQLETVKHQVHQALEQGAKIVAQSQSIDDAEGYFFPATLMVDVNHSMEIMTEETFGPVIPVMKFRTDEEAIELANDSSMALTSSIWSKNVKKAREIAEKLQSGVTTINDHLYTHGSSEIPWGGWKESGIGRTHSALGLLEMTHPKAINWDIAGNYTTRNIWWYPFDKASYDNLTSVINIDNFADPVKWLKDTVKLAGFMVKKMTTPW